MYKRGDRIMVLSGHALLRPGPATVDFDDGSKGASLCVIPDNPVGSFDRAFIGVQHVEYLTSVQWEELLCEL